MRVTEVELSFKSQVLRGLFDSFAMLSNLAQCLAPVVETLIDFLELLTAGENQQTIGDDSARGFFNRHQLFFSISRSMPVRSSSCPRSRAISL